MPIQIASQGRHAHPRASTVTWLTVCLAALIVTSSGVAQMAPLPGRGQAPEAPPETPLTLVAKIKRAHAQGSSNAQALATHAERNGSNLNQAEMRAHCDAIGSALDDAIHFTAKLAEALRGNVSHRYTLRVAKHQAHAKETYRTLLEKLRGSSVMAAEIRMLAVQIQQDITAAEQELSRIPIAKAPDAGAIEK